MAADSAQQIHRPGVFKQQNKTHKTGRHKSKGQLQKEAKGRVNVKVSSKKLRGGLSRQQRRNQTQQVRRVRRDEALAKKRGRGGPGSPPFLVAIVALCEGLDPEGALELIKTCDEEATVVTNDLNTCHINVPRYKQRFAFIRPEYGNLYSLLDAAKVADTILFLVSPEFGVDRYGEHCLSCLFAQGLPAPIVVIQGMKTVPQKKQSEAKKMVQKQLENRFPDVKYHTLDSTQDALVVLRTVGSQKLASITYRERRPHLLAEDLSFELTDENAGLGTLKVSGYIRGHGLSVNGLIHIPGWDSYQMSQIDAPDDPYNVNQAKKHKGSCEEMEADTKVLETAEPDHQVSLQSEVIPDPMDAEQTWPTEEELAEAEEEQKQKTVKRVPKGTSEYQAAWIIDDHDDSGSSGDSEENSDSEEDDAMSTDSDMADTDSNHGDMVTEGSSSSRHVSFATADEEYETMTIEGDDADYDDTIDIDEEHEMLHKLRDARQEAMFPDEVDTPQDASARVRFQRYRGLGSFRTTPWDPKEDLPSDYARIYQFDDFRNTKKRVLTDTTDSGALPGWYVTIHIVNVPKEFIESYKPGHPVVLFGLLRHEQKMSVVHFLLKRHTVSSQPIRAKERMVFHCGFRRFSTCPVYSQHTNGTKHKFERYLQDVTVATVFAPITFSPAPVLMFKNSRFGADLVAVGSLLSVNPDRIIAKRIVLSGHPFKINKKSAVVRYLFFNREDINWFKPVELRTKWGRRGHIKEPLGTHGHMKCVFDGQLKSQDTVLMNLYKRVYPKWTYESRVLELGDTASKPGGATSQGDQPSTTSQHMETFFD